MSKLKIGDLIRYNAYGRDLPEYGSRRTGLVLKMTRSVNNKSFIVDSEYVVIYETETSTIWKMDYKVWIDFVTIISRLTHK